MLQEVYSQSTNMLNGVCQESFKGLHLLRALSGNIKLGLEVNDTDEYTTLRQAVRI